VPGPDQTVLDGVLGADRIEGVAAGGLTRAGGTEPVGKCLAVVGEDLLSGH
jgi:hypothetical protein